LKNWGDARKDQRMREQADRAQSAGRKQRRIEELGSGNGRCSEAQFEFGKPTPLGNIGVPRFF
jgi:hypothetical protein